MEMKIYSLCSYELDRLGAIFMRRPNKNHESDFVEMVIFLYNIIKLKTMRQLN